MKLAQVSSPVRTVFHGAGQFLAIALYFAAIAGIIHYSVAAHNVASEASLIELSQLILLAASVFTFRRIAHVHCAYNSAASLMSAFFLVLMIRELDATLDMVFHGFWKIPALTVTALALWPAAKNWRETAESLARIVTSKFAPVLMVALALLLVYSRLFGMGVLWEQAMGANYVRDVKSIAEESTELMAYAMIWLAALGYWFEACRAQTIGETQLSHPVSENDLPL